MAATATSVNRTQDPSTGADEIKGFSDSASRVVQAMALDTEVHGEALSRVASTATAVNSLVVKASAGRLFQAEVAIASTISDARWLMLLNQASGPSGGEVPVWRARLVNPFARFEFGNFGFYFATGCVLVLSTTVDDYTAPGSSEGYFQAGYV